MNYIEFQLESLQNDLKEGDVNGEHRRNGKTDYKHV